MLCISVSSCIVWPRCSLDVVILGFFHGPKKNEQLEEIEISCREEEERVFRRYGYALECDYEMIGITGSCLRLRFLPVTTTLFEDPSAKLRNDRIQVREGSSATCGWNGIRMTTLACYEVVPDEYESLSQDDWTEFWTKMTLASTKYLFPFVCLSLWNGLRLSFGAR